VGCSDKPGNSTSCLPPRGNQRARDVVLSLSRPGPEDKSRSQPCKGCIAISIISFHRPAEPYGLVRAGVSISRGCGVERRWSIWPGVATLLEDRFGLHQRTGVGRFRCPTLWCAQPFRGRRDLRGKISTRAYAAAGFTVVLQHSLEGAARHFALPRLSLLPALAAAAFVNLRIRG